MSRLYELDTERPTDWCYTRGSAVWLRVGPFGFGVNTADGLTLSFAVGTYNRAWSWTLEFYRDR